MPNSSFFDGIMHPSRDIIGTEGGELEDQNLALCITGSVAAIRSPELARKLMRQGCEVKAIMSEMATNLITPDLMHWATGNPVVTELTGSIEHVELAQWADTILVAPATANTIGKIANGIDDTPPTSLVSVAQGLEKPIVIVPAMHKSMYSHEIIGDNLSRLKDAGIRFIEPKMEEGKAKIPPVEEIVEYILSVSYPQDLEDEKVLITAGPTLERVDPVRILTNQSTGKMGISIARAAAARGAETTLVYGPGEETEPFGVDTIRVETTEEMLEAVEEELEEEFDLFVAAAAPQDFKPKNQPEKKLRRSESVTLELIPTPGVLDKVSEVSEETFLVGFKAECEVSNDQLVEAAEKKMKEHGLDLVVANDVMRSGAGFGTDTNEVILLTPSGTDHVSSSKTHIANSILDIFAVER